MTDIEFHKTANLKRLKKPMLIVGFPGTGLVGSVAAAHLSDVLKLGFCGYITSNEFAPLAAIHNYTPLPAARIHYSEQHNLVVILSEMSIPVAVSNELADDIYAFAKSINARGIISLGGISLKEGKGDVYVVSSDKESMKGIIDKKIAKPIREGATTGVTGVLLTKGTLFKYPVVTLLAEANEEYIDPLAASNALKALSKIINIEINTAQLDKEAAGIKDTMIKSKVYKKEGSGPSAQEGGTGSMYG